MKEMRWVLWLLGCLLLAACSNNGGVSQVVEATAVVATPVSESETAVEPTDITPTDPPEEPVAEPTKIEVTAVESITMAFSDPPEVQGDIIILSGTVMDVNGNHIEGAAVEIWQTDGNGVYDHPNDPGTNGRDRSFQFYGTSVTDASGVYSFRTLKPAAYGSRPPHIHVKVKLNDATLLTTQFYFEEDGDAVQGERLFRQAGELGDLLLVTLTVGTDASGRPVRLGTKNLVVDTGLGAGPETLTPSQGEGPYYPVVRVADYDNDLVTLP